MLDFVVVQVSWGKGGAHHADGFTLSSGQGNESHRLGYQQLIDFFSERIMSAVERLVA